MAIWGCGGMVHGWLCIVLRDSGAVRMAVASVHSDSGRYRFGDNGCV